MNRSVILALLIVAAATAWLLTGHIDLSGGGQGSAADRSVSMPATKPAPQPVSVRARLLIAQPKPLQVVARGHTEAIRRVEVKSETNGRVVAIEAEKGARVQAGQVLVRLAVDERAARLAEAEATLKQRQLESDASQALAAKGFRAETKVAENTAQLDAARARVKSMQVEMAKLVIRAPFAGVVERRPVEIGDYLKEGGTIASLVDEDPFLVIAMVSEREIGKIRVGDAGGARLADGSQVTGHIRFVATSADPATRTFRVELEVPNKEGRLRDGMSAEIHIAGATVLAHYVSPAVLTLNARGAIGVRTVDDDGVVKFLPVTVLADTADGIWLGGLPERVTVITVGQELVHDGDRVKVVLEEPDARS